MASLFDFETPEQVRARIGKTGAEQDLSLAGLSGAQRANLGGATAGRLFAQGLGQAMGYESPEVTRARDIQTAMQTAQVDSEGDMGKFYQKLATNLKEGGYVKESFEAIRAMQAYNTQAAKAAREERALKVKERDVTRKEEESIPGPKRLAVLEKNAASQALKARAALIAARTKAGAKPGAKGWQSKAVTKQTLESTAAQLANDPVYQKLDDGDDSAYVGTIAQAAQDLVDTFKARNKTITYTQAMDAVKTTADKYVIPGTIYGATFNKEGFMADYLSQIPAQ
jgi:hypothetical protein